MNGGMFGFSAAIPPLACAVYRRTTGDYTTTSTSFVDVDSTNLALTIVTGAHRVAVVFTGAITASSTNEITNFDVTIDGVRQGGDGGLTAGQGNGNNVGQRDNVSFYYISDVLKPGPHTFKLQWKTILATATLYGGSSGNPINTFAVLELPYGA